MKSNMQLLFAQQGPVLLGKGKVRYSVFLTYTSEEDRRAIISQIEDRSEQSLIEFHSFRPKIVCLYIRDDREFRIVRTLEIEVEVPADMEMSGVSCFILDLIQ